MQFHGRNSLYQGIFPIRGKLLNAFNTPKARFLQNAEAAAIINLVTGGSYGKNIDMSKVKWSKIIFMTDADPDKHYFCAKNIPVRHLGNQVKIILL